MKSEQKARRTFLNPCNRSTAKYQYSFGKQERFSQKTPKNQPNHSFYNVPSTLVKRGGTLSRAKRDCQRSIRDQGPAPGQYDPRTLDPEGKVVFAPGRDKCSNLSIFYNTTISYPGPGKYDPRWKTHVPEISMGGKGKTCYETISPGPKYNFQSTLLQRNKILSHQRKKGCIKLMPDCNKSRIKTEQSEDAQSATLPDKTHDPPANQGYMSCTAKKSMGQSGTKATIGRDARFRPTSAKTGTPGPGQQYK